MRQQKSKGYGLVAVLGLLMALASGGTAWAAQSSSPHYEVNETQFGAGSSENDCSTSYCAKTSAGDTVDGSASSNNYSAQFGFNTSSDPELEVIVGGGTQNMGTLQTTTTGTATNTISVLSYLSNGYTLQITGAAPNQGTHTLTTLTTPSTSQPGSEQFGINLVANTTPGIGTDPTKAPSGSSAISNVESDYATANLFKYVDGDVVAQSLVSNGETDYTMSMVINVSNVTPGGHYNGNFSAVAVPIF
ncbi:MAG: hypothetical protein WDN27_01130 [Candidatus Saccharibacteria bacterium]